MNSLEAFNALTTEAEAIRLWEATGFGEMVPWSDYPQSDWQSDSMGTGYGSGFVNFSDRDDGKFFPVYQFEQDLSRQLAFVRRLIGFNEVTEAVSTALRVYIFGQGVEISVQPASKRQTPPELVDAVRRIVEKFSEDNSLVNNLDLELHQRTRDDGEVIMPIEREGNRILCEPVETVQLTQPIGPQVINDWVSHRHGIDCDSFIPSWSFGVLTPRNRSSRAMAYHILRDNSGDFDTYAADELVHVKRNVPRSAKRGVSDWIAPLDRLSMAMSLATSMGKGAALQAAIPWIEQYENATNAQMRSDGNPSFDGNSPNGRGNATRPELSARYRPGQIIRTKIGKKYLPGPMGSGRENGFELVEKLLVQMIGSRWLMTYPMISGDASAVNFAASLTAEAPFVKAREADQQFYGGALKSMLWKVVKLAWKLGWLDTRGIRIDELEQWVDIKVDFTSPASRDKLQLVQQLAAEVGLGTTSVRTAAVELGRDYDEEKAAGAASATPAATEPTGDTQPGILSTMGARAADVSRSRWSKVLNDFKDGKITRVVAKGMLTALSVPEATAEEYLDEAEKGTIDEVDPTSAAAVQGALESVESSEEAKQILEGMYP